MQKTIKFLNILFTGLILAVLLLIALRMINPEILSEKSHWNTTPAILATLLFALSLVPGTLMRMEITGKVIRVLVAYRRTIGLAMYFFGLTHFLFLIDYLPWFSGGIVRSLDALTASGIAAMIILLPVLLTSNTTSIRLMKKYWKWIQRMTYIVVPLIAMHLYKSESFTLAFTYVVLSLLIIISYFMQSYKKGSPLIPTVLTATLVITLAAGLSYAMMKFLFLRPTDRVRAQETQSQKAKTEELELEKISLEKKLEESEDEKQKIEDEMQELVEKNKKAEEALQAQQDAIAKKQEQEKIEQEEAEKKAEEAAKTDYKNGTYTANGPYVTDKGEVHESIDVTLNIQDDIVQSVSVVGHVHKKKSEKYHGKFEGAIGGVVIGKDIDSLNVHGVGGASDSSTGFRTALAKIKAQARN